MVKSNAEKQRDYRELKKLEDPDFLEKEGTVKDKRNIT